MSIKHFDSGFVLARLAVENQVAMIPLVGMMPRLVVGEAVEVTGDWTEHARYGRQFKVAAVVSAPVTTATGLARFLGSGLIPGVGPGIAQKIVDHFGLQALEILDTAPERLREVPGIGPKKAGALIAGWQERQAERATMIWLQAFGASPRLALRAFKLYGASTINRIQADPYCLERDLPGVGFLTADRIARAMGIAPDSPERVAASLSYVLEQAAQAGHVYLPREQLVDSAAQLLQITDVDLVIGMLHQRLANDPRLVAEQLAGEDVVYLRPYHKAESELAQRLTALTQAPQPGRFWRFQNLNWAQALQSVNATGTTTLTAEQQAAVRAAFTQPLSVVTGGPGTGKTTTVQTIVRLAELGGMTVALASPTGRAAQRLAETTGRPAATIHRLLEVAPQEGLLRFARDEYNPLSEDLIIVDEASMLDVQLAYYLLRAVGMGAHLMLVGDIDQLPSVGAGNVLRDLIQAVEQGGLAPALVVRLRTIFRQAAGSYIITNAHRINQGELPILDNTGAVDFFFFAETDPRAAADLVVDLVSQRAPVKFGVTPADIQVLAPMYASAAGVANLNQALQARLNPVGPLELVRGDRIYRVGDRVMQTRNNYDKSVFNGDMGLILAVNPTDKTLSVAFSDRHVVRYENGDLDDLTHAYAVTVHKSQGSEFPVIVMPLLTSHYMMLQRNLFYTGITRARRAVVLVGDPKAIALAVKNNEVRRRFSGLLARLCPFD